MAFQIRPSRRFTSSSSSSMVLSLLRCSPAMPSISSSTTFTSSVMLPSVRMLERIFSTIICSKRRALSLGVWASLLTALHNRLTDVVGELAALGVLATERPVTRLALDQATQQVGASDPAGMRRLGCAGAHQLADPVELGLGDDGGERFLHPHRLGVVLRVHAQIRVPV